MSMADRDGWIWYDGKMVPWRDATTHVLTHTLHYGMGVFEGVRCYKTDRGPAIFRLGDHTDRFLRSARIFGMKIPFTAEQLMEAQRACVRDNKLDSCYLRPIAFYGSQAMGVAAKSNPVLVAIAAWPWGAYLGEDGLAKGVRLKTSSFARFHPNTMLTKAKAVGHYVNSILAAREARGLGYDEALMLDVDGYVSEASGENLFIVTKGVVRTPGLPTVLAGITRASVLALLADAGIPAREERLTRDEIYLADEAFFTGTAVEVTPVRELDDRRIGSGSPGPITKRLQDLFFRVVQGREERYRSWLAPV